VHTRLNACHCGPCLMKPLRLLFSAYACEPGKGSEPGIGWRWALEAARLGHEVWVITRKNNAPGIESGLASVEPGLNLHFVYFDLPTWVTRWKRGSRGVHLYYSLWQWGAYRAARQLHAVHRFDAVQHITFGVNRHASFMGRLGLPFVLGPLGGADTAPLQLRRHFAWRSYLHDAARDFANAWARVDPLVRAMCSSASLILCRTPQTMSWLPAKFRGKAQCMLEVGNDPRTDIDHLSGESARHANGLRLLYVGRFLYLKGLGLGLRAVAQLHSRGIRVSLTMVGQGPEEERWHALARELGIDGCVHWVPWMRHSDLLKMLSTFDAMLFPSLRDAGANVVLEALSVGLPVVCLGLGGPAEMVDRTCGRVIDVEGRSEDEVIAAMADAMAELAGDRELLDRLRAGASARATHFRWQEVVGRIWGAEGAGYRTVTASRDAVTSAQ
jgi:glycosyltransferase involved in cell wall biosynthesis